MRVICCSFRADFSSLFKYKCVSTAGREVAKPSFSYSAAWAQGAGAAVGRNIKQMILPHTKAQTKPQTTSHAMPRAVPPTLLEQPTSVIAPQLVQPRISAMDSRRKAKSAQSPKRAHHHQHTRQASVCGSLEATQFLWLFTRT